MEVFTFEEIPTKIVEVIKFVLPKWAKNALIFLGVVAVVTIIAAIWQNMKKKELAEKLQESAINEENLKSKNQKLGSDNQKLTEKLNYYTGNRGTSI